MITAGELLMCDARLYTYDVLQGAWEQEPHGFEANAHHVLTHLTKDLISKNFLDPEIVQEAIVPDAMQYGLRLARWGCVKPEDLALADDTEQIMASRAVGHTSEQLGGIQLHTAAYAKAAGFLAQNLHDLGHASTRETAEASRAESMRDAGRMLIVCANYGAEAYEFNPVDAFVARLAQLRARFGIAEPA